MSSRLYEGMFLFDSNLAGRDWPTLERHVEDVLKKNSAELLYSERWPDKKLAYEVKGCRKGTYFLTYFNASPDAVVGLERDCQLSDRVLRLLVIHEDGLKEDLEKRQARHVKQKVESDVPPPERTEEGFKPTEAPAKLDGTTAKEDASAT